MSIHFVVVVEVRTTEAITLIRLIRLMNRLDDSNVLTILVRMDHLYLYLSSALKGRNVIGAGELSGHLYFAVQLAYF